MKIRYLALLLFVFIFCAGCTAQKRTQKEPVMFASFEDFRIGPKDGADLVWSTKGISDEISLKTALQKYDSMMLDQTLIVVDKVTADTLDDKQILRIARQMFNEINAKFGRWYKLVDVPTESTLRLSIVLTSSESSKPFFAETGGLLPVVPEISSAAKIVVDELIVPGNVMAELLVSDAESHKPLIATIDKQFGNEDIGSIIDSRDATKEAVSKWVERFWTTLYYWNWIKSRTPST